MKHRLLASSAILLALVAAQPALSADSSADNQTGTLEVVVVTAERHATNLQQTPISITAISGAQLQRQAKTDLSAALDTAPALQIQASPQGGQIFIRGVGANGDSDWVDPDVALMFDDVYSGRAETVLASLYDVNRIEALRGPQGTLYGRNATGGVINILTNNPALDAYQAGLNLGAGNYNLFHADGYANIPLSDTLGLRVAAERETHDGYYSNGGGAADMLSWRAKLLWQPTSSISILASVDYWHYTGIGQTTVSTSDAPWASAPFASYNVYDSSNPWHVGPLVLGPPPPPYGPGGAAVFNLLPDRDNSKFVTYSLRADWNLGWAALTLIPSYSYSNRYTLTQLFAPGPQVGTSWKENQYTGEARLQSLDGAALSWVVGVFVLSDNQTTAGAGAGGATFLAFPTTQHPATSVAPFGQINYPITKKLSLTAGARYTMDERSEQYGVCTSNDGVTCNGVYNSGLSTYKDSYSAFTYKVGLQYDVTPASMLYAQVATGYKAGGYSTTAFPPVSYQPEKLTAFELGSKNRFLDNRLQLNGELYYYNYDRYQVQYATYIPYTATIPAAYVPAGSGGEFQQFVANAGNGKNMGGEIEAKYRFTPDDEFDASVAYTQATYGALSVPTAGGPPGTMGPDPYVFTDTAIANTPKWSATLAYEHDWTVYGGLLAARVSTKLSSGYWATVSKWFGGAWQPSYTRTDLYLNYTSEDSAWAVSLWAKNLENGAQKAFVFPFFRAELADPQTFGATLSYRFDRPVN